MSVGPHVEKSNIVSSDHGRTHKSYFSVFDRKFSFCANLVKKIKIVSLSLNLVPKQIWICRIQMALFIFSVLDWKHLFWANLVQKIKLLSLSWNLVLTISHINYWDQVSSWKNLWTFWNGPLCRNKSVPFPLLNVTAYCKSSNSEACAKKLSQTLANNIENGGRGIGIRIYVRYCLKK